LLIWELSDNVVAGALKLGHFNPQTQEFSFPFKGTAFGTWKPAGDQLGSAVHGQSRAGDVSGGVGTGEGFSGGDED
jgi:hypothetical protein